MNAILEQPRTVFVVGSDDTATAVRTALSEADDVTVRHVESGPGGLDAIEDDEMVGCVVLDDAVDDLETVRGSLADVDSLLPVVYLADDPGGDRLAALTRFDATRYLPARTGPERLRETIVDALDRYHDRRVTAEESEMLQAMMAEMAIPIFVKDEKGRHLRMTEVPGGVDQDAVIGKTDLEVYGYDQEAAEQFYRDDMRVIEDDVRIDGKIEASGPPGNEHYARVTKVPWPGPDGENKGLIGVSLDVTDIMEKAHRADHLEDRLEQFAGYLSHDLKNPLSVASGHLELARETGDEDSLEAVGGALERIEEMIDDLEHLARRPPDAGLADFVEIPFVARQVWSFIETGNAELVVDMPEPAQVHVSVEQLRPLLENLFRNAVVHGEDDVTVRVGELDDGFFVADDGPGIPPADRETVLQRGYTTADDGSGTGLAIVMEIVEDNDWSLEISESAAGGASFEIHDTLLVADPDVGRQAGESISLTASAPIPETAPEGGVVRNGQGEVTITSGTDPNHQGRSNFYAYADVEGPVRIQARLQSLQHVNDFSNGGLMIRDDRDEDRAYGFLGRTVGRGTELRYQPSAGAEVSQTLMGDSYDYEWFRIDRADETLTCSVSHDGVDWETIDQRRIDLTDPITVGITVSSAVPGQPSRAEFTGVDVSKLE